jgi:N utilization substance protein B
MQSRSVSRELALLMLGQVNDRQPAADTSLDTLLQQALVSLSQHVREALDQAASDLQAAQQQLLDSELQDQGALEQLPRVRQHLQDGL